ncbi:hypothetical protein HF998_13990, partial [Cellulomonas hominis]|nr:hypothetical protein [Cellulomonas hominis]
ARSRTFSLTAVADAYEELYRTPARASAAAPAAPAAPAATAPRTPSAQPHGDQP